MHIAVSLQLTQLCASMLLGFALGAVYDVLRTIRRRLGLTALCDALFCLIAFTGLFMLGMSFGEGELHFLMLCFAALGFCLYMRLLSPAVLAVLGFIAELITKIFAPLARVIKLFFEIAKKCFEKFCNCVKIRLSNAMSARIIENTRRKSEKNEKICDDTLSGIDDAGRICYSEPCKHKPSGARRGGAVGMSAGGDRGRAGRK